MASSRTTGSDVVEVLIVRVVNAVHKAYRRHKGPRRLGGSVQDEAWVPFCDGVEVIARVLRQLDRPE